MELQYISDGEETLRVFESACAEMVSSKFIFADKRIRDILRAVAGSRRLLSVFAHAAKPFDFDTEFDKAISVEGGKKRIKLPDEPLACIAFVYSLFWEIDAKNIDVHKLLDEYYAAGQNVNDSYRNFNETVTAVFADYVKQFFYDAQIPPLVF